MSLFDIFRKRSPGSALLAKERLQVIIASEGHGSANSELVQQIRLAVMQAISRFVDISADAVLVERSVENDLEMLSVSVSLPANLQPKAGITTSIEALR
jgi:cell division topological specificity factor